MAIPKKIRGVLSPVLTPFNTDYSVAKERFVEHCRTLLDCNVGLAIFGTNSEANSLSASEKMGLMDLLVENGVPADRMMPGTGCCSISDSIELTRHAVGLGCAGTLMLPPFFYKGVSDEGLYRNYATIIDAVASEQLRIYLYHIPHVTQVGITYGLIERLLRDYPGNIAGIKDSSGDWNNTLGMLEQFQPHGFDVFAGSEPFLLQTMRHGGAGCISATANVNAHAISHLYDTWQEESADRQQAALNVVRAAFQKFPMIPAMKSAIAAHRQDPEWSTLRPPLVELTEEQSRQLQEALAAISFKPNTPRPF